MLLSTAVSAGARSSTTHHDAGDHRRSRGYRVARGRDAGRHRDLDQGRPGSAYSFLYGGADVGAKARFQRANDAGGVNGRTIDYAGFADDSGDPVVGNRGREGARASRPAVFAVVPAVTSDFTASAYLVQQKVPYFGWALSSDFCGNAVRLRVQRLPRSRRASPATRGASCVAKLLGASAAGRAVAILTENTPTGQYEVTSLTAGVQSAKFKVVYGKASLAVPATLDYNAVGEGGAHQQRGEVTRHRCSSSVASPTCLGMQHALAANGFLGVFTNQIEYDARPRGARPWARW